MTLSPIEAFDVISYSAQLQDRLSAALVALAKKPGLKREKEWLSGAIELLHASRDGLNELIERSLRLPELLAAREEHAVELQGKWVDALERLLAGITFHASSRAPLIEALFPRHKLPALRRAKREVVDGYSTELEKRIAGAYVKRMLTQEAFAFVTPVIDEVRAAFAPWRESFSAEELPQADAEAVRTELGAAGKRLEVPIRQAKLLAEAALAPVNGAYETSGIGLKPRRHTPKPATTPDAAEAPTQTEEKQAAQKPDRTAAEPRSRTGKRRHASPAGQSLADG